MRAARLQVARPDWMGVLVLWFGGRCNRREGKHYAAGAGPSRGRAAHAACGRERRRRRQTTAAQLGEAAWAAGRTVAGRGSTRAREEAPGRAPRAASVAPVAAAAAAARAGVLGPRTRQLGGCRCSAGMGGTGGGGRVGCGGTTPSPVREDADRRGSAPSGKSVPLGRQTGQLPWLFCRSVGGLLTADIPQRLLDLADCAVRRGRRASSCGCSRQQEGHSGGIRRLIITHWHFVCRAFCSWFRLFFLVQLGVSLEKTPGWEGKKYRVRGRSAGWKSRREVRKGERASRQGKPAGENLDNTRTQEGRSAVMNGNFCLQRRDLLDLPSFRVHLACCRRSGRVGMG